jgi:hypothetical protein
VSPAADTPAHTEGEAGSRLRARTPTPSIINPAGFSFTSAGIMDAIKAFEGPVREVHISKRPRPWRMSAPFEAFADRRDLGIRTVRLHHGDADHRPDEEVCN